MKKMRKSGSYLSMENLDAGDESSISEEDNNNDNKKGDEYKNGGDLNSPKFDTENIILHPIYILG